MSSNRDPLQPEQNPPRVYFSRPAQRNNKCASSRRNVSAVCLSASRASQVRFFSILQMKKNKIRGGGDYNCAKCLSAGSVPSVFPAAARTSSIFFSCFSFCSACFESFAFAATARHRTVTTADHRREAERLRKVLIFTWEGSSEL